MPLKNSILEKLSKEGRVRNIENPFPNEVFTNIYFNMKSFEYKNYKNLVEGKRVPYK